MSLNQWAEMVTLKNMTFSEVECPIMRRNFTYPVVASSKVVADTLYHVLPIVEGKIERR
jgi:hypothetical protein